MKISMIIPVLDSHKAVGRQVKHFNMMNLPDDIEFIFVDDGSNPPLNIARYNLKNLSIYATNDKRPWTQGLARNLGAKMAKGEYLFMTDIDHIISKEAIDAVYNFTGDKMVFPRYIAVLTIGGRIRQDFSILTAYGFDMSKYRRGRRRLYASTHGNTFAIKASIFHSLNGYDPRRCVYGFHALAKRGEDCYFNTHFNHNAAENGWKTVIGPSIYMFPVGRFNITGDNNPKGLFHSLSYESVKQPLLE